MDIVAKIFETAPPMVQLALFIVILIIYLNKNHSKRSEHFLNIESLKKDINVRFDEMNLKIQDVKESVNTIINAMLNRSP